MSSLHLKLTLIEGGLQDYYFCYHQCQKIKCLVYSVNYQCLGGVLHIFWVRGRAIGKGIYCQDIGIKNDINFHNFGIRNGTYLQDFAMKYKVGYTFLQNRYKFGYTFSKKLYKERVCF